ncbi:MAG: PBECR4 domain-containing protein, partial [Clostridium sp.]
MEARILNMDKLLECAKAFESLFLKQYKIVIAKKGKETSLILTFDKKDFYHLVGLQKLKDLAYLKKDRGIIFDKILSNEITYEKISKS